MNNNLNNAVKAFTLTNITTISNSVNCGLVKRDIF